MSSKENIYVTRPSLPPIEEFLPCLNKIWESRVLTNKGPFHQEFEQALCEYLGVKYISLFCNGTMALLTALKVLDISGEIITTPYSFVATANSILWSSNTPVFVDIDPKTLNIDPKKIEAAMTPRTRAILPVHCYGHPCDLNALDEIAKKNDLKLIYDAAHVFGVRLKDDNLLHHGHLSILSFHATKVFNTFEGGAIISHDPETKTKIDRLKNFGFVNETTVVEAGINAKMNEFTAALGLLQLKHFPGVVAGRQKVDECYRARLAGVPGIRCHAPEYDYKYNFAYFPIFIGQDYPLSRDEIFEILKAEGIQVRRYFYPLISEFPMYSDYPTANSDYLPEAVRISSEVMCLPLYDSLSEGDIERVVNIIHRHST